MSMHFEGPCPFLTCLETEPHDHAVCPDCGAVRYGNLGCPTCLAHARGEHPEITREMVAHIAEAFGLNPFGALNARQPTREIIEGELAETVCETVMGVTDPRNGKTIQETLWRLYKAGHRVLRVEITDPSEGYEG